jgi:hypothetical protein
MGKSGFEEDKEILEAIEKSKQEIAQPNNKIEEEVKIKIEKPKKAIESD